MDPRALVIVLVHAALLAVGGLLAVIDLRTHRLPDRIVLPTLAMLLLLVAADALCTGRNSELIRAGLGMLLLGGFYAGLRLLSPDGMGGGDLKLALVIGLLLGWHGWTALAVGGASAFVLGAIHALVLMAFRVAHGATRIAFGPWMVAGAAVGILLA